MGDTGTAIAVGEDGTILESGDGGGSWSARKGVAVHDLNAVAADGSVVSRRGRQRHPPRLVRRRKGSGWTSGTGERRQDFWAVAIDAESETAMPRSAVTA